MVLEFHLPLSRWAQSAGERLTDLNEGENMNQQDNQATNNTQPQIEDLTVDENQGAEVKGGAQVDYFLKLKGIDGEATSATRS